MKNKITSNIIKNKLQEYIRNKQDRMFDLSKYSHARVGLGHTGGHLKSQDWLNFQSGFAQAKDALYAHYPIDELITLCNDMKLPSMEIYSRANDPMLFLLRPDLGKELDVESEKKLQLTFKQKNNERNDLLIVISGGLSPLAIQHQIPCFFPEFIRETRELNWTLCPIILNPRGRVALGDQINTFFKAKLVVMLIGERPGISTPDGMSIYFTWQAKPGCTDDERNCISNIHQHGLSSKDAVRKAIYLLKQSLVQQVSGVTLKDNFNDYLPHDVSREKY